ncbi:bursicon isoform X2 [Vespa velutina]|uniref:bursicon isoform X2 n=1 Tax=Vespa velutina TaxID=202808 RepID=UPI001FB1AA74|nr:bursicon isoform X2 [Vespa velutina]
MYHNKRILWCHVVITSMLMCILFENTKAIVGIDECQATPVIHFLQYPGCIPKPIPSYACRGRCSSYLQVSGSKIWQMERSCMCCQESGEREASVSLFCPKAKPGERKFRKLSLFF